LSEAQKTVIKSEFADDSTAAGVYQDLATNQMADNMSKSGAFGFAQVFDRQLDRPDAKNLQPIQAVAAKIYTHPISLSHHE
jgi:Rod binding domain-containing protein